MHKQKLVFPQNSLFLKQFLTKMGKKKEQRLYFVQLLQCLALVFILHQSYADAETSDLWKYLKPQTSLEEQSAAVGELLGRYLPPEQARLFQVEILPIQSVSNRDHVEVLVRSVNQTHQAAVIRATTGVAAAWGFNHYLKYHMNAHVSWDLVRLERVDMLPEASFTLHATDHFRYYENVCTPGYSFAFWNWTHWEKHIDWMALQGINLPLAFTGQEAIWRRVYTKLGVSERSLQSHFAGPAFLPWGRMGNLNGWGGPLSNAWHNFTIALQHRILQRMRSFGMIPVLPAFAGHIPKGLLEVYNNVSYTKQTWNGFPPTFLLDPEEPLFQRIGTLFIAEMKAEFGTDHIYSCDTFNEMDPKSPDASYLQRVGAAVYQGMATEDSRAVWLMQGWLFLSKFWGKTQIKAFLTTVPKGNMILLDLDSTRKEQYTRTESYFGQPFIFNDLFNFGGGIIIYGRMGIINKRVFQARSELANSSMVGTGLTPEGLADVYAPTELMSEVAWRSSPLEDLEQWLESYAKRRYGANIESVRLAWSLLLRSALNASGDHGFPVAGSWIVKLPSTRTDNGVDFNIWYDPEDLKRAWYDMLQGKEELQLVDTYRYDLVDITRQVLVNLAPGLFKDAMSFYRNKDIDAFQSKAADFLDLISDLELILGTHEKFLLGNWLEQAKAVASSPEEAAQFEFNARNQVTLWGPRGQILDYAGKLWAGLIQDYYYPRWQLFYSSLEISLISGIPFNATTFRAAFINEIGIPFTFSRKAYPVSAIGDAISTSEHLYNKWVSNDHVNLEHLVQISVL